MDKELFIKDSYFLEDCEVLFTDKHNIRLTIRAKLNENNKDFTLNEIDEYAEKVVERLQNENYGNIEQAVREFAEELKAKIKTLKVGDDESYIFKFGFETLQEHLPEEIDKLIKERFSN